jgi:choline kinase
MVLKRHSLSHSLPHSFSFVFPPLYTLGWLVSCHLDSIIPLTIPVNKFSVVADSIISNSLYLSLKKVNGDVTISYTDISYEKKIFNDLNKYKNSICVPVLKNWRKVWDLRKKNIFDDAENLEINIKDKCILSIGERIKKKIPRYQFMGLVKIPNFYRKLLLKDFSNIFLRKKLQTTAFLNYLINKGVLIKYIPYNGKWFEFDDYNDFKIFNKKNKKFYN